MDARNKKSVGRWTNSVSDSSSIDGEWPRKPRRWFLAAPATELQLLPKVSHPYMVLPPLAKTAQNQI
jgi:hypothetical protein